MRDQFFVSRLVFVCAAGHDIRLSGNPPRSPGGRASIMSISDDSHRPTMAARVCPTCGRLYIPDTAKYVYRPRDVSRATTDGNRRLELVAYSGDCPCGHEVRETVEV